MLKHGHSKIGKVSKIYKVWISMNSRCNNPKNKSYQYYGGRGIKVCERWSNKNPNGFQNFIKDIGNKPGPNYSIDRVNNNLGYSLDNCRWSTKKEQNTNQKSNLFYEYKNKKQCLKDWAKEYNIKYTTLWQRIFVNGLSFVNAINTPARSHQEINAKLNILQVRIIRKLLMYKNFTLKEIGQIFSVSRATISDIKHARTWNE